MSGKQTDAFKHQREQRRRAYAGTPPLRERYPQLEQIVVRLVFNDLIGIGIYSDQTHSFGPGAKAFFAIPCPRTLCIDGGFDLDALVKSMIGARRKEASGMIECHGFQRARREAADRCRLQVNYHFDALYKA